MESTTPPTTSIYVFDLPVDYGIRTMIVTATSVDEARKAAKADLKTTFSDAGWAFDRNQRKLDEIDATMPTVCPVEGFVQLIEYEE